MTDATHIFDGLKKFPTKVCHIQLGSTPRDLVAWPPEAKESQEETLFELALGWLREDRDLRRQKEKEKGRVRGPKTDVSFAPLRSRRLELTRKLQTRDAKTFFEKYDYSH